MFSVILVTYNSSDVLPEAIASIPASCEVLVVDNASSDRSCEIAQSMGARVVALHQNLGFGTACNRGAALARNDALLFLNPDARLAPGCLDALSRGMAAYPGSVAFNPRILNSRGEAYFKATNRLAGKHFSLSAPPTADTQIPMAIGAVLAFRKETFHRLGGFDENIFLYFEDVELSARAILAGHCLHHIHDALAYHREGESTVATPQVANFKAYHFMKANLYVSKKYGLRYSRTQHIASNLAKLGAAKLSGDEFRIAIYRGRLKALTERAPGSPAGEMNSR